MNKKVLVIGLDGGTWNIIKPLVKKGKLPTIAKLMESGCYGDLESSIPHVTFPAWKCYSTGKNPGKLGVYWWIDLDTKSKKLIVNSSNSFKSLEIWDYLGAYGIKCGVIGMPTTYPPKKVSGFMVSEFNPSDSEYTYPRELENELKNKFEFIAEFSDYHGEDKRKMIEDRIRIMKQRFDATRYLAKKFNPGFLNLTIFHIDNIQHFYWKYMENNDPAFGEVIENSWVFIDSELEMLLEEFDPTHVIVLSDHGFTSLKAIFNLQMWLISKGYLILESKFLRLLNKIGLLTQVASIVKRIIMRRSDGKKNSKALIATTNVFLDLIDWENSKVVALGEGLLYINKNTFKNSNKFEIFHKKLIKELLEIKNPKIDEFIVKNVFRREEIYNGEYTHFAPDLAILPNEGYEIISAGLSKKLWEFNPKEEGWSATHKLHGIFIAYGKDIKRGHEIKGAKIYDIAPTILHIFGLPIPKDIDGRVLRGIFEEDSELNREAVYVDSSYYEESEEERIRERIKELKSKRKI